MTATALASPSPFAVFRHRNFSLLWAGQFVSTIGSSLTSLAASIYIYRATGSALSVGLMLMATAAPSLVLGLFAGVLVDRFDRRKIMLAADILRAAIVFAIPFLVPFNILWLYVLIALSASVSTFFDPAHASVLPEVASDEELAAANSFLAISSFGSTAVGFAASGLIASQFSIEWAFYIDALSFLISAFCILMLRLPSSKVEEEESSAGAIFANMRKGFSFLFSSPILRSVYVLGPLVAVSFGMWNSLLLPFARQALNATEFEYGLQEGLTSIGFVAGSLLMARLSGRLREGQWLTVSLLGMGVVGGIYASLSSVPIAILFVMISGFMNAPYSISRNLLVQRNTPREVRGRVNSAFFVTRDVGFLLGMAAAGLADMFGVRLTMLVSAFLVLLPGGLALVLPGLAQPASEWRKAVGLLRSAKPVPAGAGRMATLADFDLLAARLPLFASLPDKERRQLITQSCVVDAPAGSTILARGDRGDDVYFILAGEAVAGIQQEGGDYRSLETMYPGDFFGEIAALMATPRTADVVASAPMQLFQVPGPAFRRLIENPGVSQLVHRKFFERMARTNLTDLPRFAGYDQAALRELRTEAS